MAALSQGAFVDDESRDTAGNARRDRGRVRAGAPGRRRAFRPPGPRGLRAGGHAAAGAYGAVRPQVGRRAHQQDVHLRRSGRAPRQPAPGVHVVRDPPLRAGGRRGRSAGALAVPGPGLQVRARGQRRLPPVGAGRRRADRRVGPRSRRGGAVAGLGGPGRRRNRGHAAAGRARGTAPGRRARVRSVRDGRHVHHPQRAGPQER